MKISKKSLILQKLALSAELALKSPAFGPAALALAGIAMVGTVGCSGGSNTPDKKPDPLPVPTPKEREEAARLAEFNRLSAPVKVNEITFEIKTWDDFAKIPAFVYTSDDHAIRITKLVSHASVTDAELIREVEAFIRITPFLRAHEEHHGKNAKYIYNVIKESKNKWKACFLDETSAYVVQFMTQEMTLHGVPMDSYTSPDKATDLLFKYFDSFSNMFDNNTMSYRTSINNVFGHPKPIDGISYDSDEWFMTGLNAMFTYKIGDKDVNLFALMTQADQEAFLSKLNTKMQLEYDRYHSGYYD
ncbi:MAG: hypothetical protein FWG02_02300 [Holophagaceae bacterium]|nr:hypothetical protein [Holophagaceae bacterium]